HEETTRGAPGRPRSSGFGRGSESFSAADCVGAGASSATAKVGRLDCGGAGTDHAHFAAGLLHRRRVAAKGRGVETVVEAAWRTGRGGGPGHPRMPRTFPGRRF